MRNLLSTLFFLLITFLSGCSSTLNKRTEAAAENQGLPTLSGRKDSIPMLSGLRAELEKIISDYPGEIGVAVIYQNRDTVTLNNERKYPLMSVFKLHQALAVTEHISHGNIKIDSVVKIARNTLNPNTWSPMLKEIPGDVIEISYRELLRYALEQSDNNASNYLFETLVSPKATDEYVASLLPRQSFQIIYSEAEMLANHKLAYDNCTSPLGAAILINKLYTDQKLLNSQYGDFIRQSLEQCKTGTDRIVAPLLDKPNVRVGHKTGSGFRDNGILAAHNDVAFIQLPNGRHYSLAIFVKDFPGDEKEASEVIASISRYVYNSIIENEP